MALMERVATLLRANVNDLIDRAEDPEKMLKQLVLDMENQLLQVKTQVAIALADQHLLEKKALEHQSTAADWRAKAELAVTKGDDELARAALERGLSHQGMADGFSKQVVDQTAEAETLRSTYNKLQGKLKETQAQCEMLIAQHRRARMVGKATAARQAAEKDTHRVSGNALGRFKAKVQNNEAENEAGKQMLGSDSLEDRFAKLEREEKVERLLGELKQKQARMLEAG
ncbi:MAG TPA: PspA/IM30 family protein [Acidobacteriaceae bacterium]|jgi:phage shock protein A